MPKEWEHVFNNTGVNVIFQVRAQKKKKVFFYKRILIRLNKDKIKKRKTIMFSLVFWNSRTRVAN